MNRVDVVAVNTIFVLRLSKAGRTVGRTDSRLDRSSVGRTHVEHTAPTIGTCLEHVEHIWNIFGTYLERILFFGTCLERILCFWNVFGTFFMFWERIWNIFGTYLELIWTMEGPMS